MDNLVYICQNPKCRKLHDGSYGSGRFCSKECAKGFSGLNRSEESRHKTSVSVSRIHDHICPKCGVHFLNPGTSPNALCKSCRNNNTSNSIIQTPTNHESIKNICKICGMPKGQCRRPEICSHPQRFNRFIKYLGFNENTLGTEKAYEEYDKMVSYVYDLYWNKKLCIQEIRDLTGYKSSVGSFGTLLEYIIPLRTTSESLLLATLKGRVITPEFISTTFKQGYHITWNNKKVFYRSSYEEDYCFELDNLKIDYDMESIRIPYFDSQVSHERIAIPDFFIKDNNKIVEVKSDYTLDPINMLDKFSKYKELGYEVDLLLEHKHYPDLTYWKNEEENSLQDN